MPDVWRFQAAAIARLDHVLARGVRKILLQAPTGAGKTVIAAEVTRRAVAEGLRVLFLAPRRELIRQASGKLTAAGVAHGIVLARDKRSNLYALVQVASLD